MIASYTAKMETVTLEGLGLPQELALFEHITAQTGARPPWSSTLNTFSPTPKQSCARSAPRSISRSPPAMLAWPPGPRESDGVWAPHWYGSVASSTGFRAPAIEPPTIAEEWAPILEPAREIYETLSAYALTA